MGISVCGKDKYFVVNIKKPVANFACHCKGTMYDVLTFQPISICLFIGSNWHQQTSYFVKKRNNFAEFNA